MSALANVLPTVIGFVLIYAILAVVVGAVVSPFYALARWMAGPSPVPLSPPPPAPPLRPAPRLPPPDPLPAVCARCGAPLAAPRMVVLHGQPFCEEHFAEE